MATPDWKEPREEKEHIAVYNAHVDVSGVDEAKLVRKMDWRLLPWLSLLYLLSFLDRTSIGNAKVNHLVPLLELVDPGFRQLYNLVKDLHLSDKEYLLCLTIFYFSYSFFEARLLSASTGLHNPKHIFTGPEQHISQKTASQRLALHPYVCVGYSHGKSGCVHLP